MAIIVDADIEINSRWDTIKSIFLKGGIVISNEINADGLILEHDDITIGAWLMANNKLNGMLEDFRQGCPLRLVCLARCRLQKQTMDGDYCGHV